MTTPSVTLRSLENEDSGIDISVPRFQEEETPLGGTFVLFEISVLTRLEVFKTRLHKSNDIVHFSIHKAYREMEELCNKLHKKYMNAGLPIVPKPSSALEEKVKGLDKFMKAIAKNADICQSSVFTQFIGISSLKVSKLSAPTENTSDDCDSNEDQNVPDKTKVLKSGSEEELFPKMKNVSAEKSVPQAPKNVDLFEEVKFSNSIVTPSDATDKKSSQGLFEDFEDDDLFSAKLAEKTSSLPKKLETKPENELKRTEPVKRPKTKPFEDEVDDSEIIVKDRKPGEVSMFSEQDLGEFITKEEEPLFLVTAPEKGKSNPILHSPNEILSPDTDDSVHEDLDDLLNFAPLPRKWN